MILPIIMKVRLILYLVTPWHLVGKDDTFFENATNTGRMLLQRTGIDAPWSITYLGAAGVRVGSDGAESCMYKWLPET